MKRPVMLKALVVLQLLCASAGIALAAYLVTLTRSPEILNEKDAADTVHGLWIAVGVIGIPSLLEAVFAVPLLRRSGWGWAAGFGLNLTLAVVLLYSALSERNIDVDDVVSAAIPTVLCLLYLVPAVRRWFWWPPHTPEAVVTARAA